MNLEKDVVLGIVGGMGPEAGLSLFNSILGHTPAKTDQEHLSTIMMSFPAHIADRTAFLEGATSINPAYRIVEVINKLEVAGANIVGLACNTSYAPRIYNVILEELAEMKSQVKLLHMPQETCRYINENFTHVQRVAVMSTNGTYRAQVYKKMLEEWGYEVVVPDPVFQNEVIHRLIYDGEFGIKANPCSLTNEVKVLLDKAMGFFKEKKADAIILGCTELSAVVSSSYYDSMLMVDSTESLALALIREAKQLHGQRMLIDCNSNGLNVK